MTMTESADGPPHRRVPTSRRSSSLSALACAWRLYSFSLSFSLFAIFLLEA